MNESRHTAGYEFNALLPDDIAKAQVKRAAEKAREEAEDV